MLVAGLSAAYLLFSDKPYSAIPVGETLLNERKAKWRDLSKTLKDDEARLYQTILEEGGVINQGDLGQKSGLTKSTVSRTIDLLESKGLVEKRRRGMGNVIFLK